MSLQLWESDIYDAKIIALLIDDPKQITREQAEEQVNHVKQGYLAHVFSSCDASLAKTSFVVPLLVDWINSEDTMRQSCGYGLLYEVSKSKKKSAPNDAFFLERLEEIRTRFPSSINPVQVAMAGALIGIGKRNAILNAKTLEVTIPINPIPIETSTGKDCEPLDVVKHLTSDYLKNKFGLV